MLIAQSAEHTHALGMQPTVCALLWLLTFYRDRDTYIDRSAKSPIVNQIQCHERPCAVASFGCLGRVKLIYRGERRALYVTGDLRHCCGGDRESSAENIAEIKEVAPP